jgi:leucyl aminopeptidase
MTPPNRRRGNVLAAGRTLVNRHWRASEEDDVSKMPLEFQLSDEAVRAVQADALVVPFGPTRELGPGAAEALAAVGIEPEQAFASAAGDPEPGKVIRFAAPRDHALGSVALVCVPLDAPTPTALRHAAAAAGHACRNAARLATTLHQLGGERRDAIAAVADGLAWGRYALTTYKTGSAPERTMQEVVLLCANGKAELPAGLESGVRVAAADLVRKLVETPPNDATPAALAAEAARLASRADVSCRVWGKDDLAAAGFEAILAVGGGSANEPCMVELRYEGGDGPRIGLVGKGITFDTGGLDLKELRSMVEMKNDMAGGAAVIAATWAAAELGLNVNLVTVVPFAENLPSGSAFRPGDVIRHVDGTTTEVVSTDAEGRLVLAEALSYLRGNGLDAIVDVATLTGSTALGIELWAVLGTDRELVGSLLDAGERAGDPGWELPLWQSYRRFMRSSVADRSNSAWSGAYPVGTVLGALFLQDFVKGERWAHLDIGATADWRDMAVPEWAPRGATGSPTSALIGWLEARARRAA